MGIYHLLSQDNICALVQGIEGTRTIKEGQNPATWMLEVTSLTHEMALRVDFADLFKKSELYRLVTIISILC